MRFRFTPFEDLPEVQLIELLVSEEEPDWLLDAYRREEFEAQGIPHDAFIQENHHQAARKGTLRGLHYQVGEKEQGKLVSCLAGKVFNVVVDVRPDSPTRGRWISHILTQDDNLELWVPPGFAHGTCTLTPNAQVHLRVTAPYSSVHHRAIRWDDPTLDVPWPVEEPILTEEDEAAMPLEAV